MPSAAEVNSANNALIASKQKAAAAGQTAGATATKPASATDLASVASNQNFFLKLLTTQLQNQDPTNPTDTTQLTQQISLLTSNEQQVKTNANLEKLIAATNQSQSATAVTYIGREVESAGNTGQVVSGQGAFTYILPAGVTNASVTLSDASGNVVFQGQGSTKSGRNILVWDGVNSSTGKQEPDGIYTMVVKATDSNKKEIQAETRAVGIVSGVETASDGTASLTIGSTKLALDKVLAVRAPSRLAQASNADSTGASSGT